MKRASRQDEGSKVRGQRSEVRESEVRGRF
jgi:hypothetical protein